MCKKLIYVISFMLILSVASNAFAATYAWDGGAGDGKWTSSANWDPDYPASGYPALAALHTLNINGGPFVIDVDGPDCAGVVVNLGGGAELVVSNFIQNRGNFYTGRNGDGTITVLAGGYFNNAGKGHILGQDAADTGTLNVFGRYEDANPLYVRNGTGIINWDTTATVTGTRNLNLSNGTSTVGTFNMDGGLYFMRSGQTGIMKITTTSGAKGTLNLNGGLFQCFELDMGPGDAKINCNGGIMEIINAASAVDVVEAAIGAGQIESTTGSIYAIFDAGVTTLSTANSDLNPSPTPYGNTGLVGSITLTFDVPDPNSTGTVTADVVFGTDGTVAGGVLQIAGDNVETTGVAGSLAVSATSVGQKYYWQVKINDSSYTAGYWYSPVYHFTYANIAPTAVVAQARIDSYIPDEWATQEIQIQLDGSGSYDEGGAVTYQWTIDTNIVDYLGVTANEATLDDSTSATPVLTVRAYNISNYAYDDCFGNPGYEISLVVTDTASLASTNEAVTTVWMHCGPCNWAIYAPGSGGYNVADIWDTRHDGPEDYPDPGNPYTPGDEYIRGDCIVDLYDFAEIASGWMIDNRSTTD